MKISKKNPCGNDWKSVLDYIWHVGKNKFQQISLIAAVNFRKYWRKKPVVNLEVIF